MSAETVSEDHIAQIISDEVRAPSNQRPWVMANMVSSIDGTAAVDGTSGALGNAGDRQIFRVLRAQSDVIVAGAGTVRDEQYRTPSTPEGALGAARRQRSQAPRPALCIVTRSMRLTPPPPALSAPTDSSPTLIATTATMARGDTVAAITDAWTGPVHVFAASIDRTDDGAPGSGVDPATLIDALATQGYKVVLVEGGPTLLTQFANAGLIDELHLTVAPLLSGSEPKLLSGALDSPAPFRLDRVLRDESHLFLRYLATPAQ